MKDDNTIIININYLNNVVNNGNINCGGCLNQSINAHQGAGLTALVDFYRKEFERRGREIDDLLQYVVKLENEVKLLKGEYIIDPSAIKNELQ